MLRLTKKIPKDSQSNSSNNELLRQQISTLQLENENLKNRLETLIKTPDTKSTIISKVVDNVLIEIVSCRSVGSDVDVEPRVTNQGSDRELTFQGNTSLT